MAKRDYYEVLGVERTADEAAIKAAYRKLAKKLHPDVNPGDKDAEEKFKEVNEAYQVLSDPQKRAQYDRFGHQQPGAGGAGYGDFSGFGGFGGFDVEDIFSSFFGGGFGGGRGRREQGPVPGADLRYDMTISFEEAAKGCEKEINLVRDEPCENCHGTGAKPGTQPKTCPTCNGTGQVRTTSNTPFGAIQNVRTCPNCKGSGPDYLRSRARSAMGAARCAPPSAAPCASPPASTTARSSPSAARASRASAAARPATCLIVVTVRPHRLFKRNGTDLYLEMPLTFTQAALGCEADVPTLEKPVKYRFPEGTQPGQTFRIRGQGIPSLRGNGKGDLYVTVTVEIPKRLSEKQKNLLRQFDGTVTGQEYEQKKSFFDRVKEAFGGNS